MVMRGLKVVPESSLVKIDRRCSFDKLLKAARRALSHARAA
jgi:hypothetical protein